MADAQPLTRELTNLLKALPQDQLVEIARRAALGAFQGACRGQLRDIPLEIFLKQLFPKLPDSQIAPISSDIALCAIRNSCWNDLLSIPGQWKVQMRCINEAPTQQLRERKGPAIVAFWHHGATHVIPLGLHFAGVPALIIGSRQPPWFERMVSSEIQMVVSRGPRDAAIALKMALDRLRKGGVVALSPDGRNGRQALTVPFLGRVTGAARGVAVLARLTGAPIIPVLTTWGDHDWSIDFRIFDALKIPPISSMQPDAWEREVTLIATQRFEELVRAFPGQFRLEMLNSLVNAPVAMREQAGEPDAGPALTPQPARSMA